jgi:hypothetical protein
MQVHKGKFSWAEWRADSLRANDNESNAFHNVEISGVVVLCCRANRNLGTSPQGVAEVQDHESKAGKDDDSCAPAERVSAFQFSGIHGFAIGKHSS